MKFIFLAEFLLYFLSWGSCLWWLFDWQLSGQMLSTHALRSGINYHYHGNYQWEGSGLCGLRGPCLQLLNPCWHTHTHKTTSPSPLCTLYSWKSAVSYPEIYGAAQTQTQRCFLNNNTGKSDCSWIFSCQIRWKIFLLALNYTGN